MTEQKHSKSTYGYPEAVFTLAETYIDREILKNDSLLVGRLLKKCGNEECYYFAEEFSYDKIENFFDTSPEAIEAFLNANAYDDTWLEMSFDEKEALAEELDFDPQPQDIYEWWAVTPWLADKLMEFDQPVLKNDYGQWWGRTCTRQAIILDGIMQKIAREFV